MLSLPDDVFRYMVVLLPDRDKKMLLSARSDMRQTVNTYWFHDRVACEHLSVCPCPKKHTNVLLTICRGGFNSALQKVLVVDHPGNLCTPDYITDITIENCDRLRDLDLTHSTKLRNVTLCYSGMCVGRYGRYENNIPLPDSVEHISFPQQDFTRIPVFWRREGGLNLIITCYRNGLPISWGDRSASVNLKFVSARYDALDCRSVRKLSIPYQDESLSLELK